MNKSDEKIIMNLIPLGWETHVKKYPNYKFWTTTQLREAIRRARKSSLNTRKVKK